MRSISALDVRARFGRVLDEAAGGERFIVERAGQPVAAIVPLADLEQLDPERIRARRLAAVDQMLRLGRWDRRVYGSLGTVTTVRQDRDHGHRP